MTKKDYIKIAEILKRHLQAIEYDELRNHTQFLIDEFAGWLEDNENFNEKKFRSYIFEEKNKEN